MPAWQVALALATAALMAYLGVAYVNIGHPCGGSGGSPYAQDGSAAGHFCHNGGPALLAALPIGAVLVGLGLHRWRGMAGAFVWLLLARAVALEVIIAIWARGLSLRA